MNILLTSAGRRTYMIEYFREALNGNGKVYASNSDYTYSLSRADGYIITPLIYEDNYIDFLISFCKEKEISAIISLFDIDLYVLAKNKERFRKNGITVVVADEDSIKICNDKWETYKFLSSNGLPCPTTYIDLDDVYEALEQKNLLFPLIVKPRWGMGSIGINVVENKEELSFIYEKVKRKIFNSYLKFESSQGKDKCIVIQEMIDGQECGLDILNDLSGNFVTVVAKEKVNMRAGETDIAKTISNNDFMEVSKKLSQKLHHVGNLDVDVFRTKNNEIKILELNCRFGGQYPFSHLAGVNFPKQIINWLLGGKTDPVLISYKPDVLSCKDLLPVVIGEEK